jgi:inner membrane protein YidH
VAENKRAGWLRWRRRIPLESVGSPADPRFSFANERTFLAWNRTALALIAGGLGASILRFGSNGLRLSLDVPLMTVGGAVAVFGFRRWRASELALRLRSPLPYSRPAPALLVAISTIVAVLSLVVLASGSLR